MSRKRKRKKEPIRNAPCPCGSGRKYKHCCGSGKRPHVNTFYQKAYQHIPDSIDTYLLDTNVWGEIAQDNILQDKFLAHNEKNNYLAGLSIYNLFELTRAKHLLEKFDALFLRARNQIWLGQLYNDLQDEEFSAYPKSPKIQWMPLCLLNDESQPNLITKFSEDETFTRTRDEHLRFGISRFMSLDQFKRNYPPDSSGKYSVEQALDFSQKNGEDFLRRVFPDFLERLRNDGMSFDSSHLLSIQIRSLFAFYKYYIYDQVPGDSDFMDFATISFTPFVDYYVTERNVLNALNHIKGNNVGLPTTEIIHINDFISEIRKSG